MSVSSHKRSEDADPPLSADELNALRNAAATTGTLGFPAPGIIRTLRQHGYVEIVIGGISATKKGMERLLRERTHPGR